MFVTRLIITPSPGTSAHCPRPSPPPHPPLELWIQLWLRRTRIPGRTRFPQARLEGAVIVYSRRYNLYGYLCGRVHSMPVDSILDYDALPSFSFCFPRRQTGLLEVSGWLGALSIGAPQHPSKLFKLCDMVGGPSTPLLPAPLCQGPQPDPFSSLFRLYGSLATTTYRPVLSISDHTR